MKLVLALALFTAAAPPAEGRLGQIADLLGERKCDDAFLLLSEVKAPSPANNADLAAAREIAKRAAGCRAADPVGALAFNSLAVRLAPADREVRTAQAEGLIAAEQYGEAATLLDALVGENPAQKDPGVWLLRGKLAAREGEHDVAVRVLTPLTAVPELKAEVEPLLAESNAALEDRELRRRELQTTEARVKALLRASSGQPRGRVDPANPDSGSSNSHSPGAVIGTNSGSIGLRGRTSFTVSGLVPGRAYVFHSTGSCKRRIVKSRNRCGEIVRHKAGGTDATINGLDFRVQFGDQASRSISVAQHDGLDQSRVSFIADAPEMRVLVYDDSNSQARSLATCEVSGFSVEAE